MYNGADELTGSPTCKRQVTPEHGKRVTNFPETSLRIGSTNSTLTASATYSMGTVFRHRLCMNRRALRELTHQLTWEGLVALFYLVEEAFKITGVL